MPKTEHGAVDFVVGTGRCGSSVLHEILCQHPSVTFISNVEDRAGGAIKKLCSPAARARAAELYRKTSGRFTRKGRLRFAPSEGYRALGQRVSPVLVEPDRDLLASDATPALAARTNRFFLPGFDSGAKPTHLIHKFTGWPRARFLAKVFPEARFLHVVRDPRDVVSSWLRMSWWKGHLGPQSWHFGPLDPVEQKTWDSSGRSYVVLAALGWAKLQRAMDECRDGLGDRWQDVRFEDIVDNPKNALGESLAHFGLDATPTWVEERTQILRKDGQSKGWPELGQDGPEVTEICRPWLKSFGYNP